MYVKRCMTVYFCVLCCIHLLRKMTFSTRLVFVVVALLTAPIASRGQQECDLPTQEDVESVGGDYLSSATGEGAGSINMTVYIHHEFHMFGKGGPR